MTCIRPDSLAVLDDTIGRLRSVAAATSRSEFTLGINTHIVELHRARSAFAEEHKVLKELMASRDNHFINNECCAAMRGWDERASAAIDAVEKLP